MRELEKIVELTTAELDAVAAGLNEHDNGVLANVIVQDINVNANVLTPVAPNLNF
jgi:hypothetical protein